MNFENGHIYHIFNQGNNRQPIFLRNENYHFFFKKIATYIFPFADILAWCLMPNHFHLMVLVNDISGGATLSRTPTQLPDNFNKSIGIMLASYTRAINNQQFQSGSLFRDKTKAECLSKAEGVQPSFFNTSSGTFINLPNHEKEYPQICFNYIHNNPVKAGLVNRCEDWEFSSYREYCGLRNEKLINEIKANELELKIKY